MRAPAMNALLAFALIGACSAAIDDLVLQNKRMREAERAIAGASYKDKLPRGVEIILSTGDDGHSGDEKVWEHLILVGGDSKLSSSALAHASRSVAYSLTAPKEVHDLIENMESTKINPTYLSFGSLASTELAMLRNQDHDSCMIIDLDYEALPASLKLERIRKDVDNRVHVSWKSLRNKKATVAIADAPLEKLHAANFALSFEPTPVIQDQQGTHDKNHPDFKLLNEVSTEWMNDRSAFYLENMGIFSAVSLSTIKLDAPKESSLLASFSSSSMKTEDHVTRMHLWYPDSDILPLVKKALSKLSLTDQESINSNFEEDEEGFGSPPGLTLVNQDSSYHALDEMERRRLDASGYYFRSHCAATSADWVYDDPGGCIEWSTCSSYTDCLNSGYWPLCYCCRRLYNDAGYYSTPRFKAVCYCAGGQYSAASDAGCSSCSAGTYAPQASSSCTACPTGYYSAAEASVCSICPGGQYASTTGSSVCDTCSAGQYSAAGSASCTACPAGQYGTSTGATSCTSCAAGYYSTAGVTSCTICPAGQYAVSGSSSCTTCPAGQYSASSGSSACSNCESGTYSTSSSSTSCTSCPTGQYSSTSASTSCSNCVAGSYAASTGAVSCSACAAGTYSSNAGASSCLSCGSGTYSASGASSCSACPAGTYSASTAGTTCVNCPSGKYSASTSSSSCTNCPTGQYTSSTSSTTCTACAAGRYASSTSTSTCSSCPSGTYASGTGSTSCTSCSAGYYSASASSSSCASCSAGTYSNSASASCTSCLAGTYSAAAASVCTSCAAGQYSPAIGYSSCTNCVAGQFSAAAATACTSCSAGAYASGTANTACTSCAAGTYSTSTGASSCSNCAAGRFSPSTGATSCSACSAGTYSAEGASACTNCAAGYYVSSTGATSCSPCATGKISAAAASTCTSCGAGYYSAGSASTACSICSTGTYSASGASSCTNCPAGKYSALSGSSTCTDCASGKFSDSRASGCTNCDAGTYAPTDGSVSCYNCTAGTYAPLTTTTTCTACPGGQFSYRSGMDHCDSCEAGTYSTGGNATCHVCPSGSTSSAEASSCDESCAAGTYIVGTSCVSCPAGQYSNAGAASCTDCPAGYYAPNAGAAVVCTISPAGYIAATTGLTAVTICPAGTYSSSGASSCTNCFSGYFSSAGSSTCDSSCPAGTYSGSGSSTCIDCSAGYFSNSAASSCSVCAAGHYSATGASSCTACDVGTYATGTANTGCTACASGKYTDSTASTSCTSCTSGTYAQLTGASTCVNCPAGFYSGSGAFSCVACSAGYYSAAAASTACTACSAGRYSASSSSSCTACAAGKYSFTASTSCTDCIAGTYSESGATECTHCNNGTFSASKGSTFCSTCGVGRYTVATGAFTACTACAKGTFAASTGSSVCTSCPAGQFVATTAATACADCSAGYICLEGSSKKDEFDCVNATEANPANFYCPKGSAKRTVVPSGSYSTPEDATELYNRVSFASCPKTSVCVKGVQNTQFIWDSGTCAAGADSSGQIASTTAAVNENEDGASVGGVQFVLSPLVVDFHLDDASDSANGGAFTLYVNNSYATVLVDTAGGLNYEDQSSYNVLLYATSNGSFINCSITVSVTDVNEKPTIDMGTPPVRNISEAAALNDYVNGPPVKATDPDTADEHVYSIISADPASGMDFFGIGGCSGLIYLQEEGLDVLTQNKYNLTVRVRDDSNTGTLSDVGNVTVHVINANDAPYFTVDEDQVYCSIDENSLQNATVGGSNCSSIPWNDPDIPFGDYVVWSISRTDLDDTFSIDKYTGILYVNHGVVLDYEDTNEYSLEVTITDTGGLEASMDIVVNIIDVNEAPTTEYPTVFIAENSASGTLALAATSLSTSDIDSSTFTYAIISDGNSTNSNGTSIFTITSGTGALYVGDAGLNFEKKDSYILTVQTTDGGLNDDGLDPLSSITRVHVTVTDVNEQPRLSVSDEYWVDENAIAGSTIGYVYVIDPDIDQSHQYTSSDTDIGVVASASKVGLLFLGSTAELDYETVPTFDIDVTVSDGSLSSVTTVTIMVNNSNDAPICASTLGVSMKENTVGSLTRMEGASTWGSSGSFNFTDQDGVNSPWGQATLSVSDTQSGVLFVEATCLDATCASRTGNLTLLQSLDYETTPSATFVVTVTDGGGLTCDTFVTIAVEDVNESPYYLSAYTNKTFFIPDDAPNGESVGFVVAEDDDSSTDAFGTLTYSLVYSGVVCPNGQDVDVNGTVAIDSSSGEISVSKSAALYYPRFFCVGVRTTDGGGLFADTTAAFVISETNNQPSLEDFTIYVKENTADNTKLARLNGTDADYDDATPGVGLTFTIESCMAGIYGNLSCGARSSMFEIVNDPDSLLSAFLYLGTSQLDYEDDALFGVKRPPTYYLTIQVVDDDSVPLSSFATVTVIVVDVDEYPEFSDSSFSLAENLDAGYAVGDVSPYASDEDDDSSITFSLDDSYTFYGAMTYAKCVTTCANAGLQVPCLTSPSSSDKLISDYTDQSTYAQSYIWIGYVDTTGGTNEYEWDIPGCSSTYTNWQTNYPATTSSNCALMSASSQTWYDARCSATPAIGSTLCACQPGPFNVSEAGVIYTTAALDYEELDTYSLTAIATDNTGLSTESTVTISVTDVEEAPVITRGQVFIVSEDTARSTNLGSIEATDDDTSDSVTYALLNGTDLFFVSSSDGNLLVGGTDTSTSYPLDFECQTKYTLMVRVTDTTGLTDVTSITVIVTDVNDLSVSAIDYGSGASGMSTLGGEPIVITGTNFGPCVNDGMTRVSAFYSNGLDGLTYEASLCNVSSTDNSEITCFSAPGVGFGHTWNITVNSQNAYFAGGETTDNSWRVFTSQSTSYNTPNITKISSDATDMTTAGGTTITITGTDFPPYACTSLANCGSAHKFALSSSSIDIAYQYYSTTIKSASGTSFSYADFVCSSPTMTVEGTTLTCKSDEGLGEGLYWMVTVGVTTATSLANVLTLFPATSYAVPTITKLSQRYDIDNDALGLRGMNRLSTAGGDYVLITGTGFGPDFEDLTTTASLYVPAITVTYGPAGGGVNKGSDDLNAVKYTASDCAVFKSHTEILCTSVAGVGVNLTWVVTIAGQEGDSMCIDGGDDLVGGCAYNATTSYAPPVIKPAGTATAVTGAGVTDGSTRGGQLLTVIGVEFGPADNEDDPIVTYGPLTEIDRYVAEDCSVSVDYSTISCLTSEGVGKNHYVAVTIGGQVSNYYQANITYSTPNVIEYTTQYDDSIDGANTRGGQWVLITGRNFGTVAENRLDEVRYSTNSISGEFVETFYPCTTAVDPSTGVSSTDPYYSCPSGYNRPDTCLMITGLIDATLSGGYPKAMELTAVCDIADLSFYGLGVSQNGGGFDGQEYTFDSDSMATGDFIYVSYSASAEEFQQWFGFEADYSSTALNFNGDQDSFQLYFDGDIVDKFGYAAITGDDYSDWMFQDGWTYRANQTEPNSVFDVNDWMVYPGVLTGYKNNSDAQMFGVGFPSMMYDQGNYDPYDGCTRVNPCPCEVVTDHTKINCSTVAGAGSGFSWVVTIDSQVSTSATTDYGIPVVYGLSGYGAHNASTYGGQDVTITGVNFGPMVGAGVFGNKSFLDSVTYGPGGTEYTAKDCEVTVDHTEIVCQTVPGVGSTLTYVVTVEGQSSATSEVTGSYAPPTLYGAYPMHVNTEGGTIHVVNGTDLGMATSDAYLLVYLDDEPVYVDGNTRLTVFPATSDFMSSSPIEGWVDGDGASPWVEALSFEMPAMSDEDHAKILTIVIGNKQFGGAKTTANTLNMLYKPPNLMEIQNTAGVPIGTTSTSDLVLTGTNFGSQGTIIYNDAEVAASYITSWSDDEIQLTVIGLSGNITVVVGDYSSDKMSFDDFSPILYTSYTQYLPDTGGYRTDALADSTVVRSDYTSYEDYINAYNAGGGSRRNLTIAGLYFGTVEANLVVMVGSFECPIWPGTLLEIPGIIAADTPRSITCEVPEGTGTENEVILIRSAKSSYVANASSSIWLDYQAPVITGVSPSKVRTYGGVVTITGRNFGFRSRASAYYGDTRLSVQTSDYSDTMAYLTIPAGDGLQQTLSFTVNGQTDYVYASAAASGLDDDNEAFVQGFAYYAPNVTGMTTSWGGSLTTTGGTLTITGTDFGLTGSLTAYVVRLLDSASRRQLLETSSYDASLYETLDFDVTVDSSTFGEAVITIGEGEGINDLLVNVSGQVTLTPLVFSKPNISSVWPNTATTKGGDGYVNVTGINFGLGDDFVLRLSGPGSTASHCDHEWTQDDIDDDNSGLIIDYTHYTLRFVPPEGQCDVTMNLTLTVAEQESNVMDFSFLPPEITMLSLDNVNELGSNCERASNAGCGLGTEGGYTVTITGENFGVDDQQVYFNGALLAATQFNFVDHETATFIVPEGSGVGISVEVVVGGRTSNAYYFNYDPPYITSITPNEFDAAADLIEIYGNNFGETFDDAGDIYIRIGNNTCTAVTVGTYTTTVWQQTAGGTSYLWCSIEMATVGEKDVYLEIAGQNTSLTEEDSGVRGVCSSGYYGQQAWTVFSNSDGECEMECDANGATASNPDQQCTAFFNSDTGDYQLTAKFLGDDDELNTRCEDDWTCMINADLSSGIHANCTVLTLQDEYCAVCPVGSVCDDFSTAYSVEPIAIEGYWRDATADGTDGFQCDELREHRPYCWDFEPCAPTEACIGDNTCAKGYTQDKCAQCCDVTYGKTPRGKIDCFTDDGTQLLYHRLYGKCERCPDNVIYLLIGAGIAVIIAGLVGYRMHQKKVDLGIFSIGVDYFQVLAIFASTEVEWPSSVRTVYQYMSLFNFSINLTPPECAFEVSYRVKWMVIEWFPTVMFGLIAMLWAFSFFYFRYCSSQNTKKVRDLRNGLISGSLLIMYVLYLNISENTLDPLNCRQIEAEDGTKTKREYMVNQPSEVCWVTNKPTLQQDLVPYAWTFFFLYTIGYPFCVACILLRGENSEKAMNDQYLRCMGTGSRKETNKAYYNFRSKFSTLYFKFKPKYYFWILLIIARKLLIVTFTLLFHINATMQLSMILLVIFISYTLQVKHDPYLSRADYEDIVGDMDPEHYQSLVGPYGVCPQPKGIGYDKLLEEAQTRTVSSRLSLTTAIEKMRDKGFTREDLKAGGEEILKALFDYNTVESTLLFCAILVCLFGIMFASEFMEPGDILYERLGELTLTVIFVSLAYYFIVVWSEVVAVMFPQLACTWLSGAIDEKRDALLDDDGNVIQGTEEDEDEALFAQLTAGMDDEERDEFKIRQVERDIVYEETNPIVLRAMERQMGALGKSALEGDSDKEDEAPVLLSLEDQISLQQTVQGLLEENKKLKKKAADVEAASKSKGAAPTLKKMKNKVGGVRGAKKLNEGTEEPEFATVVKKKPVNAATTGTTAAKEVDNRKSSAMDLGDLYGGGGQQSRFDQVATTNSFAIASNPMRGGVAPSSQGNSSPSGGAVSPNNAVTSLATNPLLGKPKGGSSGKSKKAASKKAARMAASDFDNDDLL